MTNEMIWFSKHAVLGRHFLISTPLREYKQSVLNGYPFLLIRNQWTVFCQFSLPETIFFCFVLLIIGFCVLFLECYINAWAPHWGYHSSHVQGRRLSASYVRPDIRLPSVNTNHVCSKCSSPWTAKINKKNSCGNSFSYSIQQNFTLRGGPLLYKPCHSAEWKEQWSVTNLQLQ